MNFIFKNGHLNNITGHWPQMFTKNALLNFIEWIKIGIFYMHGRDMVCFEMLMPAFLRGWVERWIYFWIVCKFKPRLSVHAQIVFTLLTAFLKRKINIKHLLSSLQTITDSNYFFKSRNRISVSAFLPLVDFLLCSSAIGQFSPEFIQYNFKDHAFSG